MYGHGFAKHGIKFARGSAFVKMTWSSTLLSQETSWVSLNVRERVYTRAWMAMCLLRELPLSTGCRIYLANFESLIAFILSHERIFVKFVRRRLWSTDRFPASSREMALSVRIGSVRRFSRKACPISRVGMG